MVSVDTSLTISVFTCLIIAIVFNNLAFIGVILKHRHLQTITNWILVSMAVSDFTTGAIIAPLILIQIVQVVQFENDIFLQAPMLCLAMHSFILFGPLVTAYHLLVVSCERYFAIVFPLRYPTLVTDSKMKLCIAACWLVPLSVSTLPVMGWNTLDNLSRSNGTNCDIMVVLPCSYLYCIFGQIVIAVAIVLGLYVRIFKVAAKQSREVASIRSNQSGSSGKFLRWRNRPESRAALVLFVTVGFFILTNFPIIVSIYSSCDTPELAPSDLWIIVGFLLFFNSMVNPIIYGIGNRTIRSALLRNFRKNIQPRPEH